MKKKLIGSLLVGAMALSLAACGGSSKNTAESGAAESAAAGETAAAASDASGSGVEDGVLTIAMECAYSPYNWSQPDDSNGAVPIADSDEYANGYDIMMAKKICEANDWKLEVQKLDWDSLIPAVQAGTVDATIAGQSMTKDREEQVDFAGPYLYASIVGLTLQDSKYADAKGVSDLAGVSCTSQSGTIWYTNCLPQIKDANIQEPAESAPAMLIALESKSIDFVCTDMPTALGAVNTYPDMKILDFSDTDDNFQVSDEDVNIGIAVRKGNTELKDKINSVLSGMTKDDFDEMMNEAIKIAPTSAE